jgi:hypothetical protein
MSKWPLVVLGEVLTERKERIGSIDADGLPLLGVSNREGLHRSEMPRISDMSRYLRLRSEWFAYNPMRINVGSVGWAHCEHLEGIISPDYVVFSCRENIDPRWVFQFLKSESGLRAINLQTAGSVRDRLYFSSLARVQAPFPPLAEQRRLMQVFDGLSRQVAAVERLAQIASDEAKQLLISEELRIWPNDSTANAPTLHDITIHLSRGRQSEQGHSEHFLIKTQHVQDRRYIPTKLTLAPHIAAKVAPDAVAQPGDVLIACSAAGCLGRVAFFEEKERKASPDTHVAIARANPDLVLPEYLYAYLRGAQGQFQVRSREQGDWQREKVGFRLTELNLADLRRVPVPLPGKKEQRRIVTHLEGFTLKLDALRAQQSCRTAEVVAIRPSLLNMAFNGVI